MNDDLSRAPSSNKPITIFTYSHFQLTADIHLWVIYQRYIEQRIQHIDVIKSREHDISVKNRNKDEPKL